MVLYIVYNNIIWACIVAAVIGAGAATLVFLLKGGKKGEAKEFSAKNALVAGLHANAESFAGMYEAMYSVSRGKVGRKKDVFDMWANAVADSGDAAFIEAFNKKCGKYTRWKPKKSKKFIKAAKKLVKAFFKAGIVRSHDIYIVGDDTTAEKYHLAGDGIITADADYEVLAPFWQFGDTILEKGVIK